MANNGKYAERLFKEMALAAGFKVIDTTNNSDYFYKDIDFILEKDGITKAYEVKEDDRIADTGNLYIETYSKNSKKVNCKGWFYFCQADWIMYFDSVNGVFHQFKKADLDTLVNQRPFYEGKCYENGVVASKGWLVPLYLIEKCPSYIKIEM